MRIITLLTVIWSIVSFALGSPRPQSDPPRFRSADDGPPGVEATPGADSRPIPPSILRRDKNETQPVHPSPAYEVTCNRQKQQINRQAFGEAFAYFRQWCDSDEGEARPFDNYFIDYADVRIAICNWGLWNPCRGDEMAAAWERVDDRRHRRRGLVVRAGLAQGLLAGQLHHGPRLPGGPEGHRLQERGERDVGEGPRKDGLDWLVGKTCDGGDGSLGLLSRRRPAVVSL